MMATESLLVSPPLTTASACTFTKLSHSTTNCLETAMSPAQDDAISLSATSPNPSNNSSNETFIDPSPIAPSSNGTEFADLDEIVEEEVTADAEPQYSRPPSNQKHNVHHSDLKIETSRAAKLTPLRQRSDEDEAPQSVIHAPPGFTDFTKLAGTAPKSPSPSPSMRSDSTVKSPVAMEASAASGQTSSPSSPPPLTTAIEPMRSWSEGATPRAQTRNELDSMDRKSLGTSLEDIPEGAQDAEATWVPESNELDDLQKTIGQFKDTDEEIKALKSALAECWTLCNTLASLSSIHRERIFNFSGKGDLQENAWKSCWKLCQKLYDSRDDDISYHARPTLDLCRDFCQALFEVRVRENEAADSVLRVSFELNNHLYNTHDQTLPEAFRERTLDFYITLCHRLMKQKSRMAQETDSLLRACWSLAEMLFSLRQNKMDNTDPDEELLGSAVQACWELCDLFREGWTQVRPDRGTPRPSQTTFTQAFQQAKQRGLMSAIVEGDSTHRGFPETPTTIFEDTVNVSPDETSVPNIIVIGASSQSLQLQQQRPSLPQQNKWSSASSTLSASSSRQSSHTTGTDVASSSTTTTAASSSTNTITSAFSQSRSMTSTKQQNDATPKSSDSSSTTTPNSVLADPSFALLRLLFVKAAQNTGFHRFSSASSSTPLSLLSYIKQLPPDAFGTSPWQVNLLENFKKTVVSDDRVFRDAGPPVQATAGSVARAVGVMVKGSDEVLHHSGGRSGIGGEAAATARGAKRATTNPSDLPGGGQFVWLRDLFRFVFGFHLEQATGTARRGVVVQT